MLKCFEEMNERWFHRAFVYTGSVTNREKKLDFRYRYEQVKGEEGPMLKASAYANVCYEQAADVAEETFPWTEEGVERLKAWYQAQYENFLAANSKGEVS